MRTCGLSHQIKGPTTVKLAKTGFNCKIVKYTITGPLIWCDNPQVRMSKILYINNNNFHHLGRPQMCAGAWYVFWTWKPHSETVWWISAHVLYLYCISTFYIIYNIYTGASVGHGAPPPPQPRRGARQRGAGRGLGPRLAELPRQVQLLAEDDDVNFRKV